MVVSTIALIAVMLAGRAGANGRFPASNAVILPRGGSPLVLVRTTFGLVVSADGGAHWRWICERAIGFSGQEDPTYVVTRQGTIVASLFDGVRVSRDGGCTWERPALGDAGREVFVDVTEGSDGTVLALTSGYDHRTDAGSAFRTQLYVSKDDARTFAPVGKPLDPSLLAETVDIAPSDPSRIYISAVRGDAPPRAGALLVSTNGGARFTEHAVPLDPHERSLYIAAVDPARSDRVWLRTTAGPEQSTRLVVAEGAKLRVAMRATGPISGFALAPGGDGFFAGGPDVGLRRGSAAGEAEPSSRSPLRVQCLARRGEALWACSSESSGFVAGVSTDDGASFEARLHLAGMDGPLECPAGSSVAAQCGADAWARLRGELGLGALDGDAGRARAEAGRAGAADAADAGSAGSAGGPTPAVAGGGSSTRLVVVGVVLALVVAWLVARARR